MPKATPAEALTCMNCGVPIKSGFFCAKCQSGETEDTKKKDDGWKGSRFSGDARKQKQKQLLKEDLGRWGKRLLIVMIIVAICFGVKTLFGTQIVAWVDKVRGVTAPHDKYDPTKDSAANQDDQAQTNGSRAFSKQHNQ